VLIVFAGNLFENVC